MDQSQVKPLFRKNWQALGMTRFDKTSIFPFEDISVRRSLSKFNPSGNYVKGGNWFVNQDEYILNVDGTGCFKASYGKEVTFWTDSECDDEWVKLYLRSQVLVAILHQRKIINFHASSFIHNERYIMVMGETGVGKSSLTLSFILGGAGFLTDDLTPVVFTRGRPCVMPLNRRMKIRTSTAAELGVASESLTEAESGTGKKYMEIMPVPSSGHPVDVILKIEVGDVSAPFFEEPAPAEKFSLLRSEVCSWEILAGMPETESSYLQQIVDIVRDVKIFRVTRPAGIRINDFYESVREFLDRGVGGG